MKISVIIPVYKTSTNFEQSVLTALGQDSDDIEVICVDGVSTGHPSGILHRLQRQYSNLLVIPTDCSESVSCYHKLGVSAATGDYIMFLDPDDELIPNFYKGLSAHLDSKDADILHFGTEIVTKENNKEEIVERMTRFLKPYHGRLNNKDVFEGCFRKKLYQFSLRDKIYRASLCKRAFDLIDDVEFPKVQDMYVYFVMSFLSKSYIGIPDRYYRCNYGHGIMGHTANPLDHFETKCTQVYVAEKCKEFLIRNNAYMKYREDFIRMESDLLTECIDDWRSLGNQDQYTDVLLKYWLGSDVFYKMCIETKTYDVEPYPCDVVDIEEDHVVPIVFSVNESYVRYLSVALASILINKKCKNVFNVYIFHENLSETTKEYFRSIEREDFHIIPINVSHLIKNCNVKPKAHFGIEMYYRLFIPELLPEHSKTLYLDADLVVNGDLLDLYRFDLKGNIIGAVRDQLTNNAARRVMSKLDIDPLHYVNSGVLLIDRDRFIENDVKDKCIQLIETISLTYPDQDALNKVCYKNIQNLPLNWNCLWLRYRLTRISSDQESKEYSKYYIEYCKDQNIIHYSSAEKPWNSARDAINSDIYDIFWNYAQSSPYCEALIEQRENIGKLSSKVRRYSKRLPALFAHALRVYEDGGFKALFSSIKNIVFGVISS